MVRAGSNLAYHPFLTYSPHYKTPQTINQRVTITALKVLFILLLTAICCVVIATSLHSNLFREWDFLASIPWMKATIWDFYTNVAVIWLWICFREKSMGIRLLWLLLLVGLGSIASCVYVLIGLFTLRPGEGVRELLLGRYDRPRRS